MQNAMDTQNMGNRCVKLTVPSSGSTIHVGEDVTRYCFEEPAEYDSSPRKLLELVSSEVWLSGGVEPVIRVFGGDGLTDEFFDRYES